MTADVSDLCREGRHARSAQWETVCDSTDGGWASYLASLWPCKTAQAMGLES